jgi:hypothetical protein
MKSENQLRNPTRRMLSVQAKQSFFAIPLLWIKRHGPLDLSRTNERHLRLVSWAGANSLQFALRTEAYGCSRLSVISNSETG